MADHPTDTPAAYREHVSLLIEEAGQAQFAESRRSLFDIARWYSALAAHVERRRLSAPGSDPSEL